MSRRNTAFITELRRMTASSVLLVLALVSWAGAAEVTPADKQAYLKPFKTLERPHKKKYRPTS